ncbi:MAG TPA: ATP-binding protein [Dongiaceae bacterium]|nr:ATP-binding protein [Dongiaceae bacterium]
MMQPFARHYSRKTVFIALGAAGVCAGLICAAPALGLHPAVSVLLLIALSMVLVFAGHIHIRTFQYSTYLQNILEASPSGILAIDEQGFVRFANPAARQIFEYDDIGLVGISVEQLIPTSIRGKHPQLRASFLKERRSRRMGEGRDIHGVTRSGAEVPLEIGLTFLSAGASPMIIVGVIDIRELKAAQTTIVRQNMNLARSVKELEQFAFIASHDLREPLRKVANYAEIMQEDYKAVLDDDGRGVLRSMSSAVQRMERLLDSLLNYSRITTRAQPLESVSLMDVLSDVVEDLSLSIGEARAQVIAAGLPSVMGDRNQLRQLFQNLISNSLKYHRDEVPPVIRIESNNRPAPNGDPHYVAIVVRDNGIGFDNQYSELIFDVFKRLHGRDKYQGTGMGLAICRKIVERHEGFIQASGEVDGGAEFCIWLKKGRVR